MKACPRCGRPSPADAAFCASCGAPFVGLPPGPMAPGHATGHAPGHAPGAMPGAVPPGYLPAPPARSKGPWIVLGVLVLAGLLAGGYGLLRALGQPAPAGVAQATGAPPDPGILQAAPPQPAAGVTQLAPPPARTPMPDDVRRWLEHLQRTEQARIETTKTQLPQLMARAMRAKMSGAMEMLKSLAGGEDPAAETPPPNQEFANEVAAFQRSWQELVAFFNSYPPPTECVPIRNDYDQALRETGAMIGDVFALLADSEQNPDAAIAALTRMQGTSAPRIDEAARRADQGVAQICEKYDTRKWFDLAGDIGNSGILTQFGGL